MTNRIYTRKIALAKDLDTYFTGKQCKHGHVARRYTKNGVCVECNVANSLVWKHINKPWLIDNTRKKHAEYCVGWREFNPDKVSDSVAKWSRENHHVVIAIAANRRASKRKATPSWYSNERHQITELYLKCKTITEDTGIEHNVDHIIPLVHNNVCGLHTLSNLRIITATENRKKYNFLLEEL